MPTIFDQLDEDWRLVVASKAATRRLASWPDEALARITTLAELVDAAHRVGDPAGTDRVLASLASRSREDDLAARTLLQCLIPGAKLIARSYQQLGTAEEVASSVVSTLTEKIRSYPFERRPRRIAANLLNDTRHVLYDEARAHARLVEVVGPMLSYEAEVPVAASVITLHPAEEVISAVQESVDAGAIDTTAARVLVGHRVFDMPLKDFPELANLAEDTRRKIRLRAERAVATSHRELSIDVTPPR